MRRSDCGARSGSARGPGAGKDAALLPALLLVHLQTRAPVSLKQHVLAGGSEALRDDLTVRSTSGEVAGDSGTR
jgi:hypothetical protein